MACPNLGDRGEGQDLIGMQPSLLDRLTERARWPEPLGGRVLVACSGGADSLALSALAVHAGFTVVLGHVDHGLRADSQIDFDIVRRAAEGLASPHQTGPARHVVAESVCVEVDLSDNLEAGARRARYAALDRLAELHDCKFVFTGHTLDDQAETVLLATLRGSGIDGLSGIATRRGNLVRPLLGVRRAETAELCRHLGWAPLDDPMNHDDSFRRVWLRREVLPALEAGADRDLSPVLARQAEVVREERDALDELARPLVATRLDVDSLRTAPLAIARRAIRAWLGIPVDLAHVDAVLALAQGEGRAVDIGARTRVRRSAGRLVQSTIDSPIDERTSTQIATGEVPGRTELADLTISTRIERAAPAAWPDGRTTVVLDADVVGDRIVVRAPTDSDTVHAIGRSRAHTVTSARKRAGLPSDVRRSLPVVVRPDGTMLWALGYGGATAARVTTRTRRYCWMTVERVSEAVSE